MGEVYHEIDSARGVDVDHVWNAGNIVIAAERIEEFPVRAGKIDSVGICRMVYRIRRHDDELPRSDRVLAA